VRHCFGEHGIARKCIKVFQQKLGVQLILDGGDEAAQKLDDVFRMPHTLKGALLVLCDASWRLPWRVATASCQA
jgi:hypothetical protein